MAFDPTFGSFGDFLSVAALIKDIVVALDDCRGSRKKYQTLVQELGILAEVIEQVDKIYEDERYVAAVGDTAVTALEHAVANLRQRLEDFNGKLRKYATSLSPDGSGSVIKDAARKIQFKVEEKDIEGFQRDVLGYNVSLSILLQATQRHMMQRHHDETLERTKTMLNDQTRTLQKSWAKLGQIVLEKLYFVLETGIDLKKSTQRILSIVLTMASDIRDIRSHVMTLERPLSDPHFILEDALGVSHPIYMKTIASWNTFEFVLQQIFEGKRGSHRVLRGQYDLQDPSSRVILDRTWDWEDLFRKRQRCHRKAREKRYSGKNTNTPAFIPNL